MPHRWRGDFTVDTQSLSVFSRTLRNHYAYFLNCNAKNATQSLLRHYANIITQDTDYYADITQYIYAKICKKYAKKYANRLAKYADITQILLRSIYAIISVFRNHVTQKLRRNYAK